jgi:hypothetical protein
MYFKHQKWQFTPFIEQTIPLMIYQSIRFLQETNNDNKENRDMREK